jgi:hypothetical protein
MQSRARLSSVCTLATAPFLWTGAILPLSVNAETPKEGTAAFLRREDSPVGRSGRERRHPSDQQ